MFSFGRPHLSKIDNKFTISVLSHLRPPLDPFLLLRHFAMPTQCFSSGQMQSATFPRSAFFTLERRSVDARAAKIL